MEDLGRTGVVKALEAERAHVGDLPLTVIFKAPHTSYHAYFANRPADVAARYNRVWGRIQADLASLCTTSTLIIAERAGHNSQVDEPELIIKAIAETCAKARTADRSGQA
ncbi:hypothetical protein ACU635_34770 [[Actinomadura] parvosata]|uniref:hypothetical protein n=1 Tax=[Actinomadura] parvosata TaxID=1955412 RepID=UPI00406D2516